MDYKRLLTIASAALFACVTSSTRAESLVDIFEFAVQSDPLLQEQQAEKLMASEGKSQAWADLLPQVSFSANLGLRSQTNAVALYDNPDNSGDPDDPIAQDSWAAYADHNSTNLSGYLLLQQSLFNMEKFSELGIQEQIRQKADLTYRLAQQNLLLRVVKTYFGVLSAQGNLDFARVEREAIAKQLNHTKQRFEIGLTAVTDVHEAQARHDLAVAQELKAEQELAAAKEELSQIIGRAVPSLLVLKDSSPLNPPTPTNIRDWIDATLKQNLEITLATMDVELAQRSLAKVKGQYFPTLSAQAYYGYTRNAALFGYAYQDLGVQLNFNWPLYEGGSSTSATRRQNAMVQQARNALERIRRKAIQETKLAYIGVLAGISHVKALKQALASNEKASKAIQAGFDVSTRSALEVLDSQRELFRIQRDYAQARYNYVMNWLQLKYAVGLLVVDDVDEINGWLH